MTDELTSTLALLACPVCWKSLTAAGSAGGSTTVICNGCGRRYPVVDGIPILIPDRSL